MKKSVSVFPKGMFFSSTHKKGGFAQLCKTAFDRIGCPCGDTPDYQLASSLICSMETSFTLMVFLPSTMKPKVLEESSSLHL